MCFVAQQIKLFPVSTVWWPPGWRAIAASRQTADMGLQSHCIESRQKKHPKHLCFTALLGTDQQREHRWVVLAKTKLVVSAGMSPLSREGFAHSSSCRLNKLRNCHCKSSKYGIVRAFQQCWWTYSITVVFLAMLSINSSTWDSPGKDWCNRWKVCVWRNTASLLAKAMMTCMLKKHLPRLGLLQPIFLFLLCYHPPCFDISGYISSE